MSYLVARMQKVNAKNLSDIQMHNQREYLINSKDEIDVDRSHLNYDLVNAAHIDYKKKIMEIITSQREETKTIRKDAVLVNEWFISSDQAFFKNLSSEKTREFFELIVRFFGERYGKQNLAYAQVHFDEGIQHIYAQTPFEPIPHIHVGVVPIRDGKLSSFNVFTRKELLEIQDELPWFLGKSGFDIQRGETNAEVKIPTREEIEEMRSQIAQIALETKKEEKKAEILRKQNEALERKIRASEDCLQCEVHDVLKFIDKQPHSKYGNVYLIAESEMIRLNTIRRSANVILEENESLKREKKELLEENERLKK